MADDELKISRCGAVMHEIRNGLQCIEGMLLGVESQEPLVDKINRRLKRMSAAISDCDLNKTGCGSCANGSKING